jgi:hypothetical protein
VGEPQAGERRVEVIAYSVATLKSAVHHGRDVDLDVGGVFRDHPVDLAAIPGLEAPPDYRHVLLRHRLALSRAAMCGSAG